MPFTFFAHQSVVLPLKIKRPQWFDATALCIGSMAPDTAYPISAWMSHRSHRFSGFMIWAMPMTLIVCWLVRRWVAPTAFAHLPDFGPLRVHSLRALRHRRPAFVVTLLSAAVGAGSHIVLDSLTHGDRFFAKLFGFDQFLFNLPWYGPMTIARTFQNLGHTAGSLIGIALLAYIGRRFLMEEWYGDDVVAVDRSFTLEPTQRLLFWLIVALGPIVGAIWATAMDSAAPFRMIDATGLAVFLAALLPACQPTEAGVSGH